VGKSDDKSFTESAVITFDDGTKMMTFSERLANGIQVQSTADWRSPDLDVALPSSRSK